MLCLSACGMSTFVEQKDSAPAKKIDPNTIVDAVPRTDAIVRAGNKNPYTVLGKTYHLLPTAKGYSQEGLASWYGTKFHGRPTANGERYSLYGMTAAHRSLPIPAYVKVTNLSNGKTAIVRVNDRGPFHKDRIIDLSYAAAVKLGYAQKGTAKVRVDYIDAQTYGKPLANKPPVSAVAAKEIATTASISTVPAPNTSNTLTESQVVVKDDAVKKLGADVYYLQVAAFKSLTSANNMRARLSVITDHPVSISETAPAGFYRVKVGPFAQLQMADEVSQQLVEGQLGKPRIVMVNE